MLLEELTRAVRAGRSLARERTEAGIAARRSDLAAYRCFEPERIRAEAGLVDEMVRLGRDPGPLAGALVSVKDLYGAPGYDTFAGSPRRLPERFERPGPLVRAVSGSGAVISGKTHTVEFAFGGIGANAHWPTPRNPWDATVHRAPGGSSSGAGVSLAEGSADIALGTDTAGSVRIPASWTGHVGLKTTAGRWSTDGIVPLSTTLDTAGLLARSARDLRYAFEALDPALSTGGGGPRVPVRGLRLGRVRGLLWDDASPGVTEAVEQALLEIEAAGAEVSDVEVPEIAEAVQFFLRGTVAGIELLAFLKQELPDWIDTLEPRVGARVRSADRMLGTEYLGCRAELSRMAGAADRRFDDLGVDALVCPTVTSSPPPLDRLEALEPYTRENLRALRNTSAANQLRLCALTLPVGKDALGLPVGLMVMARAGADPRLVAMGEALEAVVGSARDRLGPPPLSGRR